MTNSITTVRVKSFHNQPRYVLTAAAGPDVLLLAVRCSSATIWLRWMTKLVVY
jgi:hypothetical protein